MNEKKTRGIGRHQTDKEWKSLMSILKAVSNGEEHRYKDIKKATGLSDPTLTKFLNRFIELKLMNKKWDTSTYPHAAYYKAKPDLMMYSKTQVRTEELSELVESKLSESKDPLLILEWINITIYIRMVDVLKQFKTNKSLLEPKLNFLMDVFVWEPFKVLTWKLMESTGKIIDKIDFEQLEKKQSERLEKIEELIKSSEE
jgi:hypothetical protein